MFELNLSEIARNIEVGPDGLWSARTSSQISYPEEGNDLCFAVEDGSFWFQHRNQCILEALKAFPAPGTFFDIGGGNGYVARALQATGVSVVLVEPGMSGAGNALKRGIKHVVRATVEDADFLPGTLPAVGLFDVIEHIQDDCAFLKRIHRLLVAGGRIYITAPAFQWLWSYEDESAGHWRRYSLASISEVLAQAGFSIEYGTYIFCFLVPAILLCRAAPYAFGKRKSLTAAGVRSDHELRSYWAKKAFEVLTRRELSKIAARKSTLFGASCLMVACRRS